ncbi:MAG: extracellular solute-binding protein, partial [Mobilitalea sp.]
MKIWKRSVVAALTLSMLVAGMTGCGKKDDTTASSDVTSVPAANEEVTTAPEEVAETDVSLKVWSTEEEQEVTTAICEEFAVAHPEYNIVFEYGVMGNDAVCDELKKDLDVAADVFVYPSAAIPELTAAGILYPITIDADTIKEINGEGAITACSKDGNLYGVPETPNSWFMYYNKSM